MKIYVADYCIKKMEVSSRDLQRTFIVVICLVSEFYHPDTDIVLLEGCDQLLFF